MHSNMLIVPKDIMHTLLFHITCLYFLIIQELESKDIVNSVLFALTAPPHCQVSHRLLHRSQFICNEASTTMA